MATSTDINLVTGYKGNNHITSDDWGHLNAGIFGPLDYILNLGNRFSYSLSQDSSKITIYSGDAILQGRHIRIIDGASVDIDLTACETGYKRIDLIVIGYEKNSSTNVEKGYIRRIQGEATTGVPVQPSIVTGNILNDLALKREFILYKINIDGTIITNNSIIQEFTPIEMQKGGSFIKSGTYTGSASPQEITIPNIGFTPVKAIIMANIVNDAQIDVGIVNQAYSMLFNRVNNSISFNSDVYLSGSKIKLTSGNGNLNNNGTIYTYTVFG